MSRSSALLLALVVALGASCSDPSERELIELETGFRGAAARDPFLAAKRVAARFGFKVESSAMIGSLDDSVGVVVASISQLQRGGAKHDSVLAWVEAGGQLVATVFGNERPEFPGWREYGLPPLLERFGVELSTEPSSAAESLAAEHDDWDVPMRRLQGLGRFDGLEIEAALGGHLRMRERQMRPNDRVGSAFNAEAYSFEVGAGRVTLLASGSPLWNGALGEADNAAFFFALLEPASRRVVRFAHAPDFSLVALLFERAPQFCIAGVALVLLWLWRLTARFGPSVVEPPPERLAFVDHIRAAGRFLFRHVGPSGLVEPWRVRVLRAVERRGALVRRDHTHATEALAASSGLAPERVEALLFGPVPADSGALVAAIHDLQLCERAL